MTTTERNIPLSKYQRKQQMKKTGEYDQWHLNNQLRRAIDEIKQEKSGNLLPLLTDECIASSVDRALRAHGYPIISVYELELQAATDEELFRLTLDNQIGIATSDRGFKNHKRHALHQTHGVVIFPSSAYKEETQKALTYFLKNIQFMTASGTGRVVYFSPKGEMEDMLSRANGEGWQPRLAHVRRDKYTL